MSPAKRCISLFAVGMLLLCMLVAAVLFMFANWLHVKNQPVKMDVAVVLAGDPSRAFCAADLFNSKLVRQIYISRPVRMESFRLLDDLGVDYPLHENIYREVLLKKGVSSDAIFMFGQHSLSTFEEALAVREAFYGKDVSLMVITSPYHVRRSEMIFRDVLPGMDITVLPTTYESFAEQWWLDQNSARNVLLELAKIVFYQLGGSYQYEQTSTVLSQ